MKNILFTTIVLLTFSMLSWAQVHKVKPSKVLYEGSLRDAAKVSVEIPKDEVQDQLNDFVKDKFDSGLKGYGLLAQKDEVMTDYQAMPLLADDAIRLIGIFKENREHTDLFMIAEWEGGEYITKSEDRRAFENLIQTGNDFLNYFVPQYYTEKVADSQEAYRDATEDVNNLKEDIVSNENDLSQLKQEVTELEHEIVEQKKKLSQLEDTQKLKKREASEDQSILEKAKHSLSSTL